MPRTSLFVQMLTEYAEQSDDTELIIPEDLSTLSDDDLADLHAKAVSNFDAVYGDGSVLSPEDVTVLSGLTEAIEALQAENRSRSEAAQERAAQAAELASRIGRDGELSADAENPDEEKVPVDENGDPIPVEERPVADEGKDKSTEDGASEGVVAASARKEIRVNLSNVHSRQRPVDRSTGTPRSMKDVMLAADVPGFAAGEGMDWDAVGRAVDRRLMGFNQSQYVAAARSGRHMREQLSVAVIRKPFDPDLVVRNSDPSHVDEVIRRAVDEKRLPGGSLVASGGWCAPSETIYDLFELESRDGLFSLPEIAISRGGINFTAGPDFSTIYNAADGWLYTEAQDEAGTYGVDSDGVGNGSAGTKPVYSVPCPSFTEVRLKLSGLAIEAGLLQQRGYPEMIARTVRGALVAHDHRLSARVLAALVTGSTAVTMRSNRAGSVAPLLEDIEMQVEHYRYVHRLTRSTTLEAVFPYWVHGALRSDLSRRNGVDMLSVTDAEIDGWFSQRGIAPQFVYNFQDITGASTAYTAWPSSVGFLLYAAGTWVKGASDVITLDTIYDSVTLGTNDYTALFTEEGWLTAKLGHDSRYVTVPLSPSGNAGGSIQLLANGNVAATNDVTDPVAGTLAGSAESESGFTLTVTGASDAGVGLDAEPYRFSTDGGLTWSEWQTSNVYVVTGKTDDTTFHCRHEVRDAVGNQKIGAIVDVTTLAGS